MGRRLTAHRRTEPCEECGQIHEACTAHNRSHMPCKGKPVSGGTTCRFHGGTVPRGALSSSFKHGRYSQYLDGKALDRYQRGLSDRQLLVLEDEIALVDTRMGELLERIGKHDVPAWDLVKSEFLTLEAAARAGDQNGIRAALLGLSGAIRNGMSERDAWSDVLGVLDQRRKLVESERKRMLEAQQFVAVGQVMLMVAALNDAVRRHVKDRDTLAAISGEIRRLAPTAPS